MTARMCYAGPVRGLLTGIVALSLASSVPLARAQEASPDGATASAASAAGSPGLSSSDAPDSAAATISPVTTLTPTAAAANAPSASCSGAYGLNADSTGRYATSACAAAASGPSLVSASPTVNAPAARPCQLYPSGSQPSTSTFGSPNYPMTPVPPSVQAVPRGGMLVGTSC